MNKFNKVRTAVVLLVTAFTAPVVASEINSVHKPLWIIEGLDQPESVVALDDETLLISNINGAPMELNAKGYITHATAAGAIISKRWLAGLNAPKGMAVHEGRLYVADMQTLRVVDIATAKIVKEYQAAKAGMLNDVTVSDDGVVYVSDFTGGGIYRLHKESFQLWFQDPQLPHPNGLLWTQTGMLVGGWGQGMGDDFTTTKPGSLYLLDTASRSLTAVPEGVSLGNLDGVIEVGGDVYVSDWVTGTLYRLGDNERVKALQLEVGLADIGTASGVIYAPMMMHGKVAAWKLPSFDR